MELYLLRCEDGRGFYNKNGQKQGKWIELDKEFYIEKLVCYIGEYNGNGVKVGGWDIIYKMSNYLPYNQIRKCEKKLESWQNCLRDFNIALKSLIMVNIIKMAQRKADGIVCIVLLIRMNINICKYQIRYKGEYKQIYSGGGLYDQEGNQKKIGKWIELVEGFSQYAQATNNGEYRMKGQKVDIWVKMDIGYNQKRGETKYHICKFTNNLIQIVTYNSILLIFNKQEINFLQLFSFYNSKDKKIMIQIFD
ncbi:unnamed protein product [Paramecium sonneborni]|uniref:Uncharacterized protein n=1 Tax=Paramecium sonneborni TaxID=65129 RepID=A0A8S1RPB3_9CILI|nr:unnamed protein product [Paramecium sonneborni]